MFLEQGTKDWLEWRSKGIGGSDAPVIMGVSPWKTPLQLWEEKKNPVSDDKSNWAMKRGTELEPVAREKYEEETGIIMEPDCCVHPEHEWLRASLDGITIDGKKILEIKCPGKKDHEQALKGKIPEKYIPQLQHNLLASGADVVDYCSFYGEDIVIVEVESDIEYQNKLLESEKEFMQLLKDNIPPEETEKDIYKREDKEWNEAVELWKTKKKELDEIKKEESEARDKLIKLAGNRTTEGGSVRVTKLYRKGRIDYGSIPELKELDLSEYRKDGSWSWRITELKEEK